MKLLRESKQATHKLKQMTADNSLQTVYLECDIQEGPVKKKQNKTFVVLQANEKSMKANKSWCRDEAQYPCSIPNLL